MEPIKLDLQAEATQQHGHPWLAYLFIGLGISNTIQGLNTHNEFRYYNIGLGLAMFAAAVAYQYYYKPKIIFFDENGISGFLSRHHLLAIKWDEISRIDVKMYDIVVQIHSGKRININLSNCTYKQHQEIKPQIIELLKRKNIEGNI